ncbi:hypothetical protein D3C81_941980 [compost metagenome]
MATSSSRRARRSMRRGESLPWASWAPNPMLVVMVQSSGGSPDAIVGGGIPVHGRSRPGRESAAGAAGASADECGPYGQCMECDGRCVPDSRNSDFFFNYLNLLGKYGLSEKVRRRLPGFSGTAPFAGDAQKERAPEGVGMPELHRAPRPVGAKLQVEKGGGFSPAGSMRGRPAVRHRGRSHRVCGTGC